MAKGIGLIGNFKGKVGNMVGYHLSDSNTGNTQGIRVYQPIVKNPKTAAQAEQRAKLAPINATYRALKMIIDRGNEGLPYGNKSRLAWLKQAFKAETMPWFVKGAVVNYTIGCPLTKGSLPSFNYAVSEDIMKIYADGVTTESTVTTISGFTSVIMNEYPWLKVGDQVTFIQIQEGETGIVSHVRSIVLDNEDTGSISFLNAATGEIKVNIAPSFKAGAIIISREGANGEHLRSYETLRIDSPTVAAAPYDADSKAAAIASYQSSASANADWAEESIQ